MTASIAELPQFHSREEGDGYVIYLPNTGSYLYAGAAVHVALTILRAGKPLPNTFAAVADELAVTIDQATDLVTAVLEVLTGRCVRTGEIGEETLLCPLSDIVGEAADRCETFGMPL